MNAPKVIGILGCNFCGSTALSAILDCLPGVLAVGETHRVIDHAWKCRNCMNVPCETHRACPSCQHGSRCKEHSSCSDCQFIPCSSHGGCRECGEKPCPIFTQELLENLRRFPESQKYWWSSMAQSGGVSVLVSSDKRPRHYDRIGHPDYLLMTIKNVREHVFSYARRPKTQKGAPEIFSSEDIAKAIRKLVRDYQEMFAWLGEVNLPVKVVSIEEVLNHPSAHVERICEWAQVPYVDTGFDYLNVPHHYIAGNFSVRRGKKNRVKHENCRWKTMLDTEMQSMIVEDPRVLAVAKKIGDLDPRAMQLFLNPNPVS
jgi:hypothetical protein